MSLEPPRLRERIDAALTEVAAAESSLDALLRELRRTPSRDKVIVGPAVETAFARLRTARTLLADLHALVADAPG